MGATSPGRWHSWHFFCRTGRTSLLNVTPLVAAIAAAAARQPASETLMILIRQRPPWRDALGAYCNSRRNAMRPGLHAYVVACLRASLLPLRPAAQCDKLLGV